MRIGASDLQHALSECSFLHGSFCATHWHLSQPDGRRERTRHNRKALGPLAPDGARQFPVRHLPLTHEFIARMPCVRRSGGTVALHLLEGDHLIKANRKYFTVFDRPEL